MSFKLVILCAAFAVISCTTINERNEQYRDQQDFDNNNQQRQEQQTFGFNNQRNHDNFNRDRQFDNFNNDNHHFNQRQNHFNTGFRHYNNHQNPTFYHLQPAFISIPSSQRNFNVQDDSHYNFGYTISDVSTGDFKSHQETRQGDKVKGQFSMIDSDGFRRTVNYIADDKHGFDAEVRREPTLQQTQQFVNNFDNQHFNNENQNAAYFNPNQPKSTTSTQVSRVEDGQQTNYATQTTNF